MELLLNLLWVLLALPAYWVWRRGAGVRQGREVQFAAGIAGPRMRAGTAVSGDLGDGRCARDARRDGRILHQQARGAAGRKREEFRLGEPAARASGRGGECGVAGRSGSWAAGSFCGAGLPRAGSCVFYAGRAPPFSLLG